MLLPVSTDRTSQLFASKASAAMCQRSMRAGISWSVLVSMLLSGCGHGKATPDATDRTARVILRILADEYGEYLATHGGQPPKDAAVMRKFIESRMATLTADFNLPSADELLKSPRDGQPLVIVCGKKITPPESPETPWAAYEQTGVDGKRLASGVRYGPVELSPEEFSQQIPTK
jgi:hypothetical protein